MHMRLSERQCPDCDFASRLTSVRAVCVSCGCSADADGFNSVQDTGGRGGLMQMIFTHQMERHQSQVNGPAPSTEIHPFINRGKKGRSGVHSAQHTPMCGLVVQRPYILTFAMVCLCTCPCVPRNFPLIFLDLIETTHTFTLSQRFPQICWPSIYTASFSLADRTCNGVCITSLTDWPTDCPLD